MQRGFSMQVRILGLLLCFCVQTTYASGRAIDCYEPLISEKPSRTESSHLKRVQSCLARNLGWSLTLCGLGSATAVAFFDGYSKRKEKGASDSHAISGGCTAAIRNVLIPLIFLPTARIVMTQIQNTPIGSWLGLHRKIDFHKTIAGFLGLAAAGHTLCSIHSRFLETQEGKSGLAIWSAILFPLFGSYVFKDFGCLNKKSYNHKFLQPHRLGFVLFSTGYAFHRPSLKLIQWIAFPVAGLAFDRWIEYMTYTHNSVIADTKIEGDKLVLTVTRPPKMTIEPGQFAYLEIGENYHPFTVAWITEDDLSFIISPVGPETQELFNRAQKNQSQDQLPISIRGPFNSTSKNTQKRSHTIVISTGSGVSVSMAKLQSLVKKKSDEMVSIIHSERNPESFSPLISALAQSSLQNTPIREIHFHLTSHSVDLEGEELFEIKRKIEIAGLRLNEIRKEFRNDDIRPFDQVSRNTSDPINLFLHFGRMEIEEYLSLDVLRDPDNIHVLISGNPKMAESVENHCCKNALSYTKESFEI